MDAHEHDILRAAEDQHWWYQTLHRQALEVLKDLPPRAHVLDAGCGTGGMLSKLRCLEAYGVDLSCSAVEHCRERGLPRVIVASTHELPFGDQFFDAVLSLDVLYHKEVDENRALAEMTRVLKPGGLLVMNLPAFDCLRGAHDTAVHGARRYRSRDLPKLLSPHALENVHTHYWNAWLFLPMLIWRRWTRHSDTVRSDVVLPPPWVNWLMTLAAGLDATLCRSCGVPLGSSLFVTARRRAKDMPHSVTFATHASGSSM